MNRFLRSASIWLAALLLTACTHAPAVTTGTSTGTGTSTPPPSQTTSAVTTTAAPLPPATEPPLTLPETAPPTTEAPPETLPTPPQQVVYPSWKEHGDIELLATIEGDGRDLLHMSQYENEVLLSFAVLGAEGSGFLSAYVQMLDLTTGILSQPTPLPAPEYVASFLENGRICLYDSMGGIAAVYDRKGNQLFSFVSGDIEGTLYLDPTGDGTLWSYTWESSILTRVPLGGGTGRTLHPDNMAAGPASYGMTDTMGRMHGDAQFAGSSSVPAHVEMMGLIGAGNNPMVGMTVAVAVAIEEASK